MKKRNVVAIIMTIVIFICGFLVSMNILRRPLNETQFEMCEQIARDVYAQKGNVIVEVPEDFLVSIDETTITVTLNSLVNRGEVIAKLNNGELVFTRKMITAPDVGLSIIMGAYFIIAEVLIIYIWNKFVKKRNL